MWYVYISVYILSATTIIHCGTFFAIQTWIQIIITIKFSEYVYLYITFIQILWKYMFSCSTEYPLPYYVVDWF